MEFLITPVMYQKNRINGLVTSDNSRIIKNNGRLWKTIEWINKNNGRETMVFYRMWIIAREINGCAK